MIETIAKLPELNRNVIFQTRWGKSILEGSFIYMDNIRRFYDGEKYYCPFLDVVRWGYIK